jgi:hypothetical protein
MGVLMRAAGMRMAVQVGVIPVTRRCVNVEPAGIAPGPGPDQDQRHPDQDLAPHLERCRDDHTAPRQQRTHDQDDRRMADSPSQPEADRRAETGLPPDKCADRDHVVHFQGMRRTQGDRGGIRYP